MSSDPLEDRVITLEGKVIQLEADALLAGAALADLDARITTLETNAAQDKKDKDKEKKEREKNTKTLSDLHLATTKLQYRSIADTSGSWAEFIGRLLYEMQVALQPYELPPTKKIK